MLKPTCVVACLALTSCLDFGKVDDAKAPGDMLGMYQVSGNLDSSTCGEGALGAGDTWNFQVKLTRFANDIYWLNGQETLVGDIASDGRSFSIQSGVEVKVSSPGGARKGCVIDRRDEAEGKLSDSGDDVESFRGSMSYRYDLGAGSDCTDWLGTEGAVDVLPCTISYSLKGERTAAKN